MKARRNTLARANVFKLAKLIEAEFSNRNDSDAVFAEWATTVLGFEVNDRNVHSIRTDLGIAPKFKKPSTFAERIADLEARVAQLEKEWKS